MRETPPASIRFIVLGFDEDYNFVNLADPADPKPLRLDLKERTEVVFRLSDDLIRAGWTFQRRPIDVAYDYGVNFSSYVWVKYEIPGHKPVPHTQFKIIYECVRMGDYDYSLFLLNKHKQRITLDPDIDNGMGQIP